MSPIVTVIIAVVCLAAGCAGGFAVFRYILTGKYKDTMEKAEKAADVIKEKKLLEVKEKFLNKKSELEKEVQQRTLKIQQGESRLKQREVALNQRQEEINRRRQDVEQQQQRVDNEKKLLQVKQQDLEKMQEQERTKLEELSGLSSEEAKKRLKGRIIGREGRNIRALEAATGVEIVVDDTPEAIVISAFDPVRREICRLALHQLVADGRIHPARIEEVVAKVKKQLDNEIIETGKRTAIDLGIHGLHPELIRIVGKMKYRSSYGQNLLQHARETANLCAVMASELGLNPKKAKRAGLLHDIGKVPDEETDLPHALYGGKIAEKYKEKPDICNAIAAHHDEVEMTTLLAPIVQVCDAISGARPGARREIVEAYIKRLNDLEAIAMSYPGVTKTYAIQAGRELRVIVGADKMDDAESEKLSSEIAEKIQNEMTYPGQVKITVIRETRSVAYAK